MSQMHAVFFIYGLAFFTLGFGIIVYPKKEAGLSLAYDLWLVGAFGVIHGINEWIDMFMLGGQLGPDVTSTLRFIRTVALVVSFLLLLLYGSRVNARNRKCGRMCLIIPVVLFGLWAVASVGAGGDFYRDADIMGRYFLAVPGIYLTAYAFLSYLPEIKSLRDVKAERRLLMMTLAFVLYGVFAGFVVPEAEFFPADRINYRTFKAVFGFPVQEARTACAVLAVIGTLGALRIFTRRAHQELVLSHDELNALVYDRTRELVKLNEELEHEIAEKIEYERGILSSLEEKEALLREVHHRVKNNMQIITSLLRLESRYIQDPAYAELFAESSERIRTMMTVQERLYASENLSHIAFEEFFRDLVRVIFRAHKVDANNIRFSVDAGGHVLQPDTAVPLGLVVHELVVNSLAHGFPEGRNGEILLTVRRAEDETYELEYRDTGIGLPQGFDLDGIESLGLELVKVLCLEQLQGSIETRTDGGAIFVINFREPQYRERIQGNTVSSD